MTISAFDTDFGQAWFPARNTIILAYVLGSIVCEPAPGNGRPLYFIVVTPRRVVSQPPAAPAAKECVDMPVCPTHSRAVAFCACSWRSRPPVKTWTRLSVHRSHPFPRGYIPGVPQVETGSAITYSAVNLIHHLAKMQTSTLLAMGGKFRLSYIIFGTLSPSHALAFLRILDTP